MRISDWSSDVCSSDLLDERRRQRTDDILLRALPHILIENSRRPAECGIRIGRLQPCFLRERFLRAREVRWRFKARDNQGVQKAASQSFDHMAIGRAS